MGYIYCITNLINGKQYIGKTTLTVDDRFKEHCRAAKKERCEKRPLYDAMNKYGTENFKVEQVIECPVEQLDYYESKYIEEYDTFGHNGYNATKGGDGSVLFNYSEIVEVYKQGGTLGECAKKCNCSIDTVRTALKNYGITPRRNLFKKEVLQYDLDGNFLRKFESMTDTIKWLYENGYAKSINNTVQRGINRCSKGELVSSYKFKWKVLLY